MWSSLGRVNPSDQATLGVRLDATDTPAEITVDGHRLTVIGYAWEPTTELIAVDTSNTVWSCTPDHSNRTLMNSSPETLRRFLDLFAEFFAATAEAEPPPMHLSADQMAEKLAAFSRGEIKSAAPRKPDNRKARIKKLKKTLAEIDKPALKTEWWSTILEQVDDGIL